MKRITEEAQDKKEKKNMTGRKKVRGGARDVGSEGQSKGESFQLQSSTVVYQSNVCRNNGFKGYALHNAEFNKMHRLWKIYIAKK